MDDLLAARAQMAVSLGFHIVFAVVGMAMPLLMCISEARWLKTRDPVDLELTRRWARGTAILFAVGAVSGTVLSFELGLLWPEFMRHAGPVIGMPFSLEGFAFFLEAIGLGIFLYGWDRVPPALHWAAGVVVATSGVLSGIFEVLANAWMNTPTGFDFVDGRFTNVDPVAAMASPAAFTQTLHMTLAAYLSVGIAVAAIHAFMLLRDPRNAFHRRAFAIAFPVAAVTAVLQIVSGDLSARHVAEWQPAKFAAMEAHWRTERRAPLRIGGLPDERAEVTRWAIEIPGGLSFLAHRDVNAPVRGLSEFPRQDRPPVLPVHLAFQIMLACGLALLGLSLTGAVLALTRRDPRDRSWFLKLVVACGPLGVIALEAGWTVTEVGRQPWIVHGIMRTRDAVTPMPNLQVPFLTVTALYLVLAAVVLQLLKRQVFASPSNTTRSDDAVA
jgi:cytochrome d ubiquinol oxidase subunit I